MKRLTNMLGTCALASILLSFPRATVLAADRGEIRSGETRSGTLAAPSYMDTWTFDGQAGDRVVITSASDGFGLEPDFYLYPPDSGPVEASSAGSYANALDHQLAQSGQYTMVVRDGGMNQTGVYSIALARIPGPANSEGDLDGGAIAPGMTMAGTVSMRADSDLYQFYGQTGDRVLITSASDGFGLEADVYLYPPDSGPLEASSGGSYANVLDHQLAQTGLYTIVVRDGKTYGLTATGAYSIALARIPGPATSELDSDGGPIASGMTMGGTVSMRADSDAYQFYGQAGDRVVITSSSAGFGLQPDIYLYPPDSSPAEVSSTGSYDNILDYQLAQSGLYTIVVRDGRTYGLTTTGEYSLSMTKIPSAPRTGIHNSWPPNGGSSSDGCFDQLSWDSVTGADGYDVWFGTNVVSPLEMIAENHREPFVAWPELEDGQVYYWYVVARTVSGDIVGPWCWFRTDLFAVPDIAVSPASLEFGSTGIASSANTQSVTVSNHGTAALCLQDVAITSGDSTDFVIESDGCSQQQVFPGDACTVDLRFIAASNGAKMASLQIASNDPDTSTVQIPLTGTTVESYALTATVIGGHGTIAPTEGTYVGGAIIDLTAVPDEGYRVKAWSGTDNDPSADRNTNVVMMDSQKTVTVEFEKTPPGTCELTVTVVSGHGRISPAGGIFEKDMVVTLTAIPDEGYRVKAWTGVDSEDGTTATVTMGTDRTVTVEFEAELQDPEELVPPMCGACGVGLPPVMIMSLFAVVIGKPRCREWNSALRHERKVRCE